MSISGYVPCENCQKCLAPREIQCSCGHFRTTSASNMLTAIADSGAVPPPVQCPKCRSTQVSGAKAGLGLGKAATGMFFAGPVALAAGLLGRKAVVVHCTNCGHLYSWKAQK